MTEAYNVPHNFIFYLVQTVGRCKDEIAVLEHQKRCHTITYYAVNIPVIVVGSLSVFLPAIVPTLMSAVQGVYTFFNVNEEKVHLEQRIYRVRQLIDFLTRENMFNVEAKIGRYFNGERMVEIKTDDDFEEYILFIEKYVDSVLSA